MEKKIGFWAKNRQKNGFFGVRRSTLRRFGISPYDSDDAQTHIIATILDAQTVATIKKATYEEKNWILSQKPSKKWIFWGIQVYTKTLRNFTVCLQWCSNSHYSHPNRCTACFNNKNGNFIQKKIAFRAKNRRKSGFFGVFRSTLRRFGISPYASDDAQTHIIATQLDAQGIATIKAATLWRKKLRFEPKTVKKSGFFGDAGLH